MRWTEPAGRRSAVGLSLPPPLLLMLLFMPSRMCVQTGGCNMAFLESAACSQRATHLRIGMVAPMVAILIRLGPGTLAFSLWAPVSFPCPWDRLISVFPSRPPSPSSSARLPPPLLS